jgi:phage-related protein
MPWLFFKERSENMNNANGGNVIYHFKGDSKDLDKTTSKVASGVKSAFKVATGAIVATTTAVTALVTASVKGYAEFEQLEGGLESLFGKGSAEMNSIIKSSEQAYKDLTMSQNQYLTAFETAYPLVNSGLAENKDAIEYTNKVLQVSSDLFNTYGQSTEYYQNAINWALKGTYSYLDNLNLGIKGTQEGFIEAANSSGILGRTIKDVSELTNDEIIDVIMHYADEYGVLGKTADEAGSTILGSLNMMKSAWSNFMTGFSKQGADMGKLTEELVNSAVTFLGNLFPVIERALGAIADALPGVIEKIVAVLPGLLQKILPALIKGAITLLKSLGESLPTLIPILMDAIVQAIKGLVKILPQLIQSIIEGAIMIIQALADELPTLLPMIVDAILQIIPILLDNLPLLIEVGGKLIVGLLNGIMKAIPKILSYIPKVIRSIVNVFNQLPGQLINIGANLIRGLWSGIQNVTSWIIGKIKGFGKSVMSAIKGIFGVHSPSTEWEFVGRMNMLGFEKGLEEMQPQLQDTIDSMFNLQPNINGAMSSTYSPNMVVNVQNNMELDPLGQLVNRVKTFSGGAKNDYNWGAGL